MAMMAGQQLSPGQVIEEPIKPQDVGFQLNLNRRLKCPDCRQDPPNLIEDWAEGNVLCAECGLVLETHLVDQRSEWRTFASDDGKGDDPSRIGKAEDPNDPNATLNTMIGNVNGQRDGGLHRAHAATMHKEGMTQLENANSLIRQLCATFNIPHVTQSHAEELYRSCNNQRELKGKSIAAVTGACVLLAARRNSNALQFKDVARAGGSGVKEITRAARAVKEIRRRMLSSRTRPQAPPSPPQTPSEPERIQVSGQLNGDSGATTATSPAQLCAKYGSMLTLDRQTQAMARNVAEYVSLIGTLDGRNPNTAAGAALFLASQLLGKSLRSFKDIAKVAKVNDSTIRGAYKKLFDEKERVVKPEWLGKDKGDLERLPAV